MGSRKDVAFAAFKSRSENPWATKSSQGYQHQQRGKHLEISICLHIDDVLTSPCCRRSVACEATPECKPQSCTLQEACSTPNPARGSRGGSPQAVKSSWPKSTTHSCSLAASGSLSTASAQCRAQSAWRLGGRGIWFPGREHTCWTTTRLCAG